MEERIYLRLLAERHTAQDSRQLLREYIAELLHPDDSFSFITESDEHLKQKWDVLDEYFVRGGLLTESKKVLAEGLLGSAWEGIKSLAGKIGGKVIDAAVWVKNNAKDIAKKYGKETIEILKKIGGKLHEVVVYAIKLLPGGEIVLEFLSTVAGSIEEKIKEMSAAIGKKVEEFVSTAKKKIVDFFFEYVLKDPALKAEILSAMGLKESRLNNVSLLVEEESGSSPSELVAKTLGLPSPERAKAVVAALQGKGDDPAGTLRDAGGDALGKLIDFWLKLVKKDPKKYHEPFFKSGFFEPLGTGYGFAATAILGILAASELPWKALTTYVNSIMRGFKGGMGKPEGAQTKYAAAYLFLGNKSNEYDASLFKSFITGIIKGSNLEVIVRALSGDVSKIPELVKRLLKTIINGIKEKINEASKKALEVEGIVSDGAEEAFSGVMEKYVDDAFSS